MASESWKVFIVDDDEAVRESLRALLESHDLEVADYESGVAFLDDVGRVQFGCLLLDMHLPVMSGLEILSRLRADGHALPVVMVTGRGDRPLRERLTAAGANAYFEKPFSSDDLIQTVLEFRDRTAGASP